MNHLTLTVVLLAGSLFGLGLFWLVSGLVPTTPSLSASLDRMDGRDEASTTRRRSVPLAVNARGSERVGAWVYAHLPYALRRGQLNTLKLRDISVAQFFGEKLILMLVCAFVPALLGIVAVVGLHTTVMVPAGIVLAGAVVGWFIPDLQLRGGASRARADAGETLFTFFDLVTLERLANLSGTQALHSAAGLSDATLFGQIRAALERARLEQQPPYAELKRLAEQLRLPELADLADVMRLDETGAALSGTLRARVKELRDAHLTEAKIAANAVSERMTVFMVIPAMVFGLIFLVPPLLRLAFS